MSTWIWPSFENQATNGKLTFYGLHEKKEPYFASLDQLAKMFLPECAKGNYRPFRAQATLNNLCDLGMFQSNPEELVIGVAFLVEAHRAIAKAHPESALPWPGSKPFWECHNGMLRALAQHLAPFVEADVAAVIHKLYGLAKIFLG